MNISASTITDLSQKIGMVFMCAAAAISMLELPSDRLRVRAVVPNQPAFAFAGNAGGSDNTLRREKEDTAPHYISYSESQRTPARSGKW